ncbi:prephenate dehydratase [Gorillibacterium sp. sgz5001074]|uniref:prephenate dehydratase n=1 Tax=Gorillibacterium sp. sgz5001074 TaxID=3446695 RepID=UPI003F67B83C
MKRIGFLGPVGTVSHEATVYFFQGEDHEFIPFKLVADIFAAASEGRIDLGVIPIENTIEGSVRLHVDSLVHEESQPIQAEWTYPSVQNLIGHGSELMGPDGSGPAYGQIRKILSIDVAIAQCRQFLGEKLPQVEFEYVSSTAEGVRLVRDHPGEGLAAIGTSMAASMYGLERLAHNITDHHNNYTRFVLVGKEAPSLRAADAYKTTILVTLPEDFPGALHQVLSAFAWRRINLSKIESRPTKLRLGSYYFYIDIEGSLESVLLPAALEEIEALGCQVRILGSYPCYPYSATHS